jgi:alanyl-tRNA synthetase
MVQFKSVFLGEEARPYSRAATSQKCIRAGGKHNDLENVGHTARHHTFFEMLGNFSFGDYFKRDAIRFGWDLLTEQYSLPKDKLWVTIFTDDDEADSLWQEVAGVAPDRIVRMGAKDNFWQMADTGPCGPCSEIHIDQGVEAGCGSPDCKIGCDCDRFLELWNLVFMQFNRDAEGNLHPLPKPSIDTGMGLERIAATLQGKRNNFDSDLFADVIQSISTETGVAYGTSHETDASIRVIADHARACAFMLSDGIMPANDGRGYVLRRIIRRAARHARILGTHKPVLSLVTEAVTATMGHFYPELITERQRVEKMLLIEEERFDRTLEQGMKILDDLLSSMRKSGETSIPGGEMFKLYDTFGFPPDLMRDIANDSGLTVDEAGFTEAMESQRERARASWVGQDEAIASVYRDVLIEAGPSEFTGYYATEGDAVVKAIIMDGKVVEEVPVGSQAEVILDRTPFYGESGGQLGDRGVITGDGMLFEVLDTKRPMEGLHAHKVLVKRGPLKVWAKVHVSVDAERRHATMRNHTATHLLQAALQTVLGDHVKQAGSLVSPERLRFDFTHFSSVDQSELAEIQETINQRILANATVSTEVMDASNAMASGAMALFGEKYGETVRVVTVEGFSKELCGGTHCSATGEIGPFIIESEGSVASGIRRIEAITGTVALARIEAERRELKQIASLLKTSERPIDRVQAVLDELRTLQREQDKLKGAAIKDASGSIIDKARTVGNVKLIVERVDGLSPKDLRSLADNLRDRLQSGVIVIASEFEGQASLLAMVTKDLTDQHKAGEILRQVAAAAGGRGGGKPDMAQGGTKELDKLDAALARVEEFMTAG